MPLGDPLVNVRSDLDQVFQDCDWQAARGNPGRGVGGHVQGPKLIIVDVQALQAGIASKPAWRGLNEVRDTSAAVELDSD